MLSRRAIEDFIKVYKEEFGVEISEEHAQKKALEFLRFFSLIYKPIEEKQLQGREVEVK